MSQALHLQVTSRPARMLKKAEAASYCGIPLSRFDRICPVVAVIYPDGSRLWDLHDVNAWLDNLKAGSTDTDKTILDRLG